MLCGWNLDVYFDQLGKLLCLKINIVIYSVQITLLRVIQIVGSYIRYEYENHKEVLKQFEDFANLTPSELPVSLENYRTSNSLSRYDIESFWIDMYKIENEKYPFKLLSFFFINLMTIPHSNCYVERQFSQVSLIKNEKRNLLEVTTMSSILKVKSYYEDTNEDVGFEPQEKDYYFYNLIVNSKNC